MYICAYTSIYMYICTCLYIYIYIYNQQLHKDSFSGNGNQKTQKSINVPYPPHFCYYNMYLKPIRMSIIFYICPFFFTLFTVSLQAFFLSSFESLILSESNGMSLINVHYSSFLFLILTSN
jgi:sensor histidine kinase YesM